MAGETKLTAYLFAYRFDGAEYGFDVAAYSLEEARARVKAMSFARYDGELVARIPVVSGAGLVVRAITGLRNFFARPQ